MEAHGVRVAFTNAIARAQTQLRPLARRRAELEADAARAEQQRTNHVELEPGTKLIAQIVFCSILAAIGGFCFWANRSLEVGLLETLGVESANAAIIGTTTAAFTALLGVLAIELLFPSGALPRLASRSLAQRVGMVLVVLAAIAATATAVAAIAEQRAASVLGPQLTGAQTRCAAAEELGRAVEIASNCGLVGELEGKLAAAKRWDRLVATAAPLGEIVGSYGLVRLLELGAMGAVAGRARAARRRVNAIDAEIGRLNDGVERDLILAATAARVDHDEVRALFSEPPTRTEPPEGDDDPPPTGPEPSPTDSDPDDPAPGSFHTGGVIDLTDDAITLNQDPQPGGAAPRPGF
jgi:hypothetical protein